MQESKRPNGRVSPEPDTAGAGSESGLESSLASSPASSPESAPGPEVEPGPGSEPEREADVGSHVLVRCLMQVVWPAFIGAAMTVGLLFSLIDPVQIEWVSVHLSDSRPAAYTLGFLVFWGLFSVTCSITWFLATTETPGADQGGRPDPGRHLR